MRLEPQQNAAVLALTGKPTFMRLVLTPAERAALERARKICEEASTLLGEGDDGEFLDAEARLAAVLD